MARDTRWNFSVNQIQLEVIIVRIWLSVAN
jgi:hypothetical protein